MFCPDEDEDEDEDVGLSRRLRLSVVSVFVLQAVPVVERQRAVGERARVTPTTQTGLQRERQGERQRDSLIKGILRRFNIKPPCCRGRQI